MATYIELRVLINNIDTSLRSKVEVAVIIAAEGISSEADATTNHAARLVWAARAFENPTMEGRKAFMAVLAANKDAPVAQITTASDIDIQTNVDAVVNVLAGV